MMGEIAAQFAFPFPSPLSPQLRVIDVMRAKGMAAPLRRDGLVRKALSYSGVSGVKFRLALLIVNPLNCRRFFAGRENLPWRIRANFRFFLAKALKKLE
jgi:hypothetical protein